MDSGPIRIGVSGLHFEDNHSLANLGPTWPLTQVGGGVKITSNNNLASLGPLRNITAIGGDLTITEGSALVTTAGLNGVTTVGGTVFIFGTPVATVQFPSLTTANIVKIRSNGNLVQILLNPLQIVGSKFVVEGYHPGLRMLDIGNLQNIGTPPMGSAQGYFYENTATQQWLTFFIAPAGCPNYWDWMVAYTNAPNCASFPVLLGYQVAGCGVLGTLAATPPP